MTTWIHAIQVFVAICVGFSTVCVAVGWLIKIIKGIKRPKDDIDDKLQRDYDRINKLDKDMKAIEKTLEYIKQSLKIQMENDKVILEHMRTNNATGDIAEREKATFNFLNSNQWQ